MTSAYSKNEYSPNRMPVSGVTSGSSLGSMGRKHCPVDGVGSTVVDTVVGTGGNSGSGDVSVKNSSLIKIVCNPDQMSNERYTPINIDILFFYPS